MEAERSDSPRHPIRVVARRTGLTPAVLRAWEKRYRVVVPSRTEGGQRLYSDNDVLKLSLLHRAVEEGRSISQVATLPTEALQGLVREDEAGRRGMGLPEPLASVSLSQILENADGAVERMDSQELERVLVSGAMAFSVPVVVDDVVVPLLTRIGSAWDSGRIGPAQEHLATATIRKFLDWMMGNVGVGQGAPVLVAATPAGDRHELGALLSALSGASEGWRSFFLGPDLPASEIVSAALRMEARVVALSCVDPRGAGTLADEILKIRGRLPASVSLVVGGTLPAKDPLVLGTDGVEVLETLKDLRESLRTLGNAV